MDELQQQYFISLRRLLNIVGTEISFQLRDELSKICVNSMTKENLETSIALYEYHSRRLLAESARIDTYIMLKSIHSEFTTSRTERKRRKII